MVGPSLEQLDFAVPRRGRPAGRCVPWGAGPAPAMDLDTDWGGAVWSAIPLYPPREGGSSRRGVPRIVQREELLYKYEAVFIYPSGADKLAAGKETVAQEFASAGVTVLSEEDMAERELAYPVQGSDRGHYILYNIEAPDQAVGTLERILRIKADILRFHFYRYDPKLRHPKPSKA